MKSKRAICFILSIVMLLGVLGNELAFSESSNIDLFQFVEDKYILHVGDELVLIANASSSRESPSVEYTISSSNPLIVEVSDTTAFRNMPSVSAPVFGSVRCAAPGAATVTLSSSDGRSKECAVLVLDNNPWSSNGTMIEDRAEEQPGGNDWWAEAIHAYDAWGYVDAHKDELADVTVGIIDSGFDTKHEELEDKIQLLEGYKDNTKTDHGTNVAGIIGAKNDNKGIRGIADTAIIMFADWTPVVESEENPELFKQTNLLANYKYLALLH